MPEPGTPDAGAGRQRPRASGATRSRPSTRPARLMIGAGAVAALTVIGAGLVRFPTAAEEPSTTAMDPQKERVIAKDKDRRPVKYVRLKPGQKAPKGAKVIREALPTPRIVVRRVSVPSPQRNVRTVTRTRQSG